MQQQMILVSFCNLPKLNLKPLLFLEIPFEGRMPRFYAPKAFENLNMPINSATGLTRDLGKIYSLLLSEKIHHLALLQSDNFSLASIQKLMEIKDGHSILVSGSHIYVVSTGTDEVLRYELSDNELRNPQLVWKASDSKSDTHHINSIIEISGEIYISAFGPKADILWSSATNGYIHNVTRDVRVKEGIYHPHSLSQRNGNLYYCDSSRKSFCTLDAAIFELEGYTRGIGWLSDELVCVASSIGRRISKSTGLIANPADPGAIAGKSRLIIRNIKDQKLVAEIDLSRFGPEIYDVMPLDGDLESLELVRLK